MTVLSVKELHHQLEKMMKKHKGAALRPVYLMVVEDGCTSRQAIIGAEYAEPYDGDFVWLFSSNDVEPGVRL